MTKELAHLPPIMILNFRDHDCDWQVGDTLMSEHRMITIVGLSMGDNDSIVVHYRRTEDGDQVYKGTLDGLKSDRYIKLEGTIDDLRVEAIKAITDPEYMASLDMYGGQSDGTTALAFRSTPSQLAVVYEHGVKLRDRAELIKRTVLELMEPIKEMQRVVKNRLGYVGNALDMLNAFLGVYERVVLLRDGAPCDDKLHIRQLILFMDEEAGLTEYEIRGFGGIDFTSIDRFDQWILAHPGNLERVLPERKGIVALKPSRQKRSSGDWWASMQEDEQNSLTYFLIRNGEKLYRICTGFALGDLLYPRSGEFAEIMQRVANERASANEEYKWQGVALGWRRNIALIQGLIERTDVFAPLPHVDLFSPQEDDSPVVLISDGEKSLTDGRQSFRDWRASVNSQVKVGDRIYLSETGFSRYETNPSWPNRLGRGYRFPPDPPQPGVYTVEGIGEEYRGSEYIKILYMPEQDVWSREEDEYTNRKRRESFKIYRSDSFWISYGGMDLGTISYYIDNRLERKSYLHILPLLKRIRDELRAEQRIETQFAELLAGRLGVETESLQAHIEWWKNKVIQKRPIAQDDAKAWRMIERRVRGLEND